MFGKHSTCKAESTLILPPLTEPTWSAMTQQPDSPQHSCWKQNPSSFLHSRTTTKRLSELHKSLNVNKKKKKFKRQAVCKFPPPLHATSRCIGAERKFQNRLAATESRYCAAYEARLQSAVNRMVSELHTCMPCKQDTLPARRHSSNSVKDHRFILTILPLLRPELLLLGPVTFFCSVTSEICQNKWQGNNTSIEALFSHNGVHNKKLKKNKNLGNPLKKVSHKIQSMKFGFI